MKKTILIAVFAAINVMSLGQVFNTGQTLKPKTISVGFEPAVLINGSNEFMLFLHGGYGLTRGIDVGITAGVLGPDNYFGANVEFVLGKNVSLAGGAHSFGSFGLDGTLNLTFGLAKGVRLITGLDTDINFPDGGDTQFLLWIPAGVDIGLRKNMSFILEAEIGLTDPAYNLIGGGVVFYF
ncbi:hypothetical protein [Tenuifilum osseticum]|uniref:hypothetical protein n=1 Tax=Tenuifilum osseticum TaxID=3374723 RepID=UPI0034E4AFF2